MGNCASAMDGLIPWGWGAKSTAAAATANPAGMSASKRTTSSATTTGKLSTVSTSTFMASTVSGGSTDDCFAEGGHILESPNLRIFTFAELRSACKNFRAETVLGEGGFGKVYKGWVDVNPAKGSTTMVVAVKKLNPESVQGMEQWQNLNRAEDLLTSRVRGGGGSSNNIGSRYSGRPTPGTADDQHQRELED